MLQFILPVAIAALAGVAYVKSKSPPAGTMSPDRQAVLDAALANESDPAKLRALAKVFTDANLPLQAELLLKRATLRELPADVKEARKAAFRAGMASANGPGIRALADEFEKEGATGAAAALRAHAFEVEHPATPAIPPVVVNTGTVVDGHPLDPLDANVTPDGNHMGVMLDAPSVPQQAAILVAQQEALPDPTTSPEAAALAASAMSALEQANALLTQNSFLANGEDE
jgi:hypothetical protein